MIPERIRPWLASPSATRWAVAFALVLASPSLFEGLQGDDFNFLAAAQDGESATNLFDPFRFRTEGQTHVAVMKERGELPWWVDDGARLRFWRPITSVSHYLDFVLWPNASSSRSGRHAEAASNRMIGNTVLSGFERVVNTLRSSAPVSSPAT